MKLSVQTITLRLNAPFRIAHGTTTERHNVIVRLGEGIGEGALPPYYGTSMREVVTYLHALDADALLADDPPPLTHLLDALPDGPAPARAAVDMALHDHWARRLGHPLYRLWGLDPGRAPVSAQTLSLPRRPSELRPVARSFAGAPLLKIKLGTGDPERDLAIVQTVREETSARLCVDANGAWSLQEAARLIPRLAEFDLLFIEQPLPAGDHEAWHLLRRYLPRDLPPLIADESARTPDDVIVLAGAADGINVKVSKVGGLAPALRMITLAHALEMKVLLGCMIESSLGLTAAAHLAPLADFLDLDALLFLAADPFAGLHFDNGLITLPDRPGHGAVTRDAVPT